VTEHVTLTEALENLEITPYPTVQENVMAVQEKLFANYNQLSRRFMMESKMSRIILNKFEMSRIDTDPLYFL
jgi:hypothetical protein